MMYSIEQIKNQEGIESVRKIALEQYQVIAEQNEKILMFELNEPNISVYKKSADDLKRQIDQLNCAKRQLAQELKDEKESRKLLERLCRFVLDTPCGCDE